MRKLKVKTAKTIAIQHISGDVERWDAENADIYINYPDDDPENPESIAIFIKLRDDNG